MIVTFAQFLEEQEYREFLAFDFNKIDESLFGKIGGSLKRKVEFIRNLADQTGRSISELASTFKNKKVFKFFTKIGWSFKKLFELLKKGYKAYGTPIKVVSEYVANNPVTKWTDKKLAELDTFLKTHPKTRRIAGIAVAALLVYIWFHVSFSGDISTDFDMSGIISALSGSFSLSEIFSGGQGILIIGLLLGGTLSGGFPWPSRANIQFISAIVGTLVNKFKHSA